MVDDIPRAPLPPLPDLSLTPEQLQQARRLAEAGTRELESVKEPLEPRRPSAVTERIRQALMTAWGARRYELAVGKGNQ